MRVPFLSLTLLWVAATVLGIKSNTLLLPASTHYVSRVRCGRAGVGGGDCLRGRTGWRPCPDYGMGREPGDVVLSFHIMLLTLNAARRNPRLTGIGFRHAARARKRRNARYELNYLLALPRVELVSQSSPRVITIHNAPSSEWIRLGTPTALRLVIGES